MHDICVAFKVKRGRRKQAMAAAAQLKSYAQHLEEQDLNWRSAVVLVGRGKLGDLDHILGAHAQIHVAEGEAVREATRKALDAMNINHCNHDEKSVLAEAAAQLAQSPTSCDSLMQTLKPTDAKSWRKEERLIALAAWLHSA